MPALVVLLLLTMQSDSARLVSHARGAQEEFERARLFLVRTGAAGHNPCDARIGRFCYSYSGGGRLPEEPSSIAKERTKLLVVLDTVARALPGDPWVAGQRVRYLLEAGQSDSAVEAARACRATAWWCSALAGLAWHVAGKFEAAERSFQTALDSMPEDERCRWTDLADLLANPLRDRYRRLACGARRGLETRIWWLARPLWSLPGNDRRTEHFARLTMTRLLARARWGLGQWGDDARELVVRYGWPQAWERDDCGGGCEPIPLGYLSEPSFHFLPEPQALVAGSPAAALEPPWAQERYAPAYASTFEALEPDFATFRRGDSTLLVASWDVSRDTMFADTGRGLVAAAVLARDELSPMVATRRSGAAAAGTLVAEAAWEPTLACLELLAPAHRAAGRIRARLSSLAPPPGAATLSGILLFEPAESLPADLPAALARVHAGGVPVGHKIGLYWEAYGLAARENVSTAVAVTPEHTSWLRRVATALGLASRPAGVRLEWPGAVQPPAGTTPGAVILDLTGLAPGRYRVAITVSQSGRAPATSSRWIDVGR